MSPRRAPIRGARGAEASGLWGAVLGIPGGPRLGLQHTRGAERGCRFGGFMRWDGAVLWFNCRGCRKGQYRGEGKYWGAVPGGQYALPGISVLHGGRYQRAVPAQPPARRCGQQAVPATFAPPGRAGTADKSGGGAEAPAVRSAASVRVFVRAPAAMSTGMYQSPMEVAVYQLHNFSISFFSSLLGGDVVSVKLDNR